MPIIRITTALLFLASSASAEVVVLANRTPAPVTIEIAEANGLPASGQLAAGEVRPIFGAAPFRVSFDSPRGRKSYALSSASAYYLAADAQGAIDLAELGLPAAPTPAAELPTAAPLAELATVPVVIYADDEQLLRPEIWGRQLVARVEAASEILERHARVRLSVQDVRMWDSDDATADFTAAVGEFERECPPVAGQLVIGFSSQFQIPDGRIHMGGTRGPLWTHILLREWSGHASERERLELLLHELGHYLGATHSPEPDSVMRPLLVDRKSRRVGFDIRFDPLNTLAIAMVGEELRRGNSRKVREFSPATRRNLGRIYAALGKSMPADPSAMHYQQLLGASMVGMDTGAPAKRVLAAIMAAARGEQMRVELGSGAAASAEENTDRLVRAGAAAAAQLPPSEGPKAFVLALGLALGDAEAVRKYPRTATMAEQLESPAERRQREQLGIAAQIHGRSDTAKHFFVSALLTAATTAREAEQLGVAKEMLDAQGGSGFSFADLAADAAGIRFAEAVLAGQLPLAALAENFRTVHFVPPLESLPEGLQNADFLAKYGGMGTDKFRAEQERIEQLIDRLPPYALQRLLP